jgi:crossover junction endodeoxyribonuclease RuvC
MRVLGIDCGSEFTGFGVVDLERSSRATKLVPIAAGAIRLNRRDPMPQRLAQIYAELTTLMELHRPEAVAIEDIFHSVNSKSALKLGQVRGVALLAAANCGLPIAEYAPLTVKCAVTGYGLADKSQVQFMVARLLGLAKAPEPADAADALAVAICHLHTAASQVALNT